ncbi:MAG: DegT/DnrJ/EryC1/StrS family aminotransferase [Propionibacteriales bacterium]|nr:DegT/DnrJ/EryC1/StrS family aminotransferase [Propionibacteriales bacterium]
MTVLSTNRMPAIAGGEARFPEGLPLARPILHDLPALERRLADILASGMLTNGRTVRELEERVAERLGVAHAVAVASCTTGLALTLQALDANGPVVMPSFTFAASAHAVVWAGGTPVFADITLDTLCLDPAAASALVEGASAMTATHLYGTPCRTESLAAVAESAGIPLVYDAAHALGSARAGTPVGGFGAAEVFSLSPTKVVVAGEGGLVTTRHADLAAAIRLGRDYGNPGDYDCRFPGLNARMSELHAAVALHSLDRLDVNLAQRNGHAERFWSALAGLPGLRRPKVDDGDLSTFKDLTIVVDQHEFGLSAAELAAALRVDGIDTRRYYHPPIHLQHAYRMLPARELPITEAISQQVLSVPLWSDMTDEQMLEVADAIVRIHAHRARVRTELEKYQPAAMGPGRR